MSKHTPKPWIKRYEHHGTPVEPRSDNSGIVIRDADGALVADVKDRWIDTGVPFLPPDGKATRKILDHDTTEANAALIVAAPDLLDACKKALAWIGQHNPSGERPDPRNVLVDAIQKAEG